MSLSPASSHDGAAVVTREQFVSGPTAAPADTTTLLPWTKTAGSSLLDLTVPTVPLVIVSGVYAVTCMFDAGAATAGQEWWAQLDLDASGEDAFTSATSVLANDVDSRTPQISLSLVYFVPAGQDITARVRHSVVAGISVTLTATVQRLS